MFAAVREAGGTGRRTAMGYGLDGEASIAEPYLERCVGDREEVVMLLGRVNKCHRCHVHNVSPGYDKKFPRFKIQEQIGRPFREREPC